MKRLHSLLYYLKSIDNIIPYEEVRDKALNLISEAYCDNETIDLGLYSCKKCNSENIKIIELCDKRGMIGSQSSDFYIKCFECNNKTESINNYGRGKGRIYYDLINEWNNNNTITY
jgi:hypothetical protein